MKIKKEAKIGIFGVLMLVVLFWGVNFLKGRDIFQSTRTYYATFENANGLKLSTEVLLKGLKIGDVTDIVYNPLVSDRIVVQFTAGKEYEIPTDSRIIVSNKYIIGGAVLNLEYGGSTNYFKHNDTIPAQGAPDVVKMATSEIESLKEKATILVDNINATLENVNALLSEQNINNITGTLSSVNHIMAVDVKGITGNLNTVSQNLSDNSQKIDNIISNVEAISDSLKKAEIAQLVANANITVEYLNATLYKINNGEGSAAKLVNDTKLYDSLVRASSNLSLLLEDLKLNPKRYINISVFGGGKKNK